MNVLSLVSSLVWAAVAVYTVQQIVGIASRVLARWENTGKGPDVPAIPPDLLALSVMESEEHARKSVHDAILEAWERYKNWNQVRVALGVATTDEDAG